MDITALLGTTPHISAQTSASTESADTTTFAQNLSQASDRQDAAARPVSVAANPTSRSVTPKPAADQQSAQPQPAQAADTAPSPATAEDTPQPGSAQLTDAETPAVTETAQPTDAPTIVSDTPEHPSIEATEIPQAVAQPAVALKPAIRPATQPETEQAPAEPEPVDISADAPVAEDPLNDLSDSDSQLQQIRDRMHLIDNAGNLDTSSVTPGYVPIIPTPPVSTDVPTAPAEADSPQIATVVSQNISPLLKDTPDTDSTSAAEPELTPLPAQAVQAEQINADIGNDDHTVSHSDADTPDLAAASDSSATTWSPTPFTASHEGSASTASSPVLTASVGSAQWQVGLSQQVLGLHQRGKQQVDLQLHPADLGPLSISLKVDDSGTQAQFISAHPAVRSAVEQAIPHLREALAAQGISLGQTSVSDQPSRQTRDDQAAGQFSSSGQSSGQAAESAQDSRDAEADSSAERESGLSLLSGRVDVYT